MLGVASSVLWERAAEGFAGGAKGGGGRGVHEAIVGRKDEQKA